MAMVSSLPARTLLFGPDFSLLLLQFIVVLSFLFLSHYVWNKGLIKYDVSKLSGQKQRIMDSTIMDNLNWSTHINLDNGIAKTV